MGEGIGGGGVELGGKGARGDECCVGGQGVG